MNKKIPTCILSEPFKVLLNGKWMLMLNTDVGHLLLREAAKRVSLKHPTLRSRIDSANDAWRSPDIFAEKFTYPEQDDEDFKPQPKIRRFPESLRVGTWEKIDRFVSRFSMAQTRRDFPERDREYNDALKYNRAVAR